MVIGDPLLHSYPYSKHDFQLILHQMKLKRMETEQKAEKERRRRERLIQKKDPKLKEFKCSPCDMTFPNKVNVQIIKWKSHFILVALKRREIN